MADGYTLLPHSLDHHWARAEDLLGLAVGDELGSRNPFRNALAAYEHGTGIEAGYGFFAPSVPNSYKVVFEIRFQNAPTEYELPRVSDDEMGLRLSSLLEQIGHVRYDPLRELMLKMLAYPVWKQHPDASAIRAVFGYVDVPSAEELEQGKQESYNFLYAYDFTFRPSSVDSKLP